MNKRSQSQKIIIKRNKNTYKAHFIPDKIDLMQRKEDPILKENSILHSKINESKSILETIYSKVKRKEAAYQQKIAQTNEKCSQLQQIGRQYKDYSQEQLRVIHANSIVQRYNGLSNYLSHESVQKQEKRQQGTDMIRNYKSMKDLSTNNVNISSILVQYKNKNSLNEENRQNIYEMYLKKVNKNMRGSILSRDKTEEQTAINKARRLSKEIENDLEDLKIKKNMSSNNLKIKQCMPKCNAVNKDKKSYFLQLQKRKLKIV